jgi:hypothetical protein
MSLATNVIAEGDTNSDDEDDDATMNDGTFLTQGDEDAYAGDPGDYIFDNAANSSQSTRLHQKMREMKEMDAKLAAMKDDYAKRLAVVRKGEQKFLEKQKNTIDYLRKFKAFIVETDAKRNRALQKAAEEHRHVLKKSKELGGYCVLSTLFLVGVTLIFPWCK